MGRIVVKDPELRAKLKDQSLKKTGKAPKAILALLILGMALLGGSLILPNLLSEDRDRNQTNLISFLSRETQTPPVPSVTADNSTIPTATSLLTVTATASPSPTFTMQPPVTATATPLPTPDGLERSFIIPVLMYHYISTPPEEADIYRVNLSVTPDTFAAQMEWLSVNGYTTITFYELIYALSIGWPPLPEKPVILTFDDGYVDNYENAYPILKKHGLKGVFFILTDVTDRGQDGYMTWEMLKEMSANGMGIEVHGREHIEYSGRDYDWLIYHLLGPQQTIEANLGYIPRFIAYPSGAYDAFTIEVAKELGFWGGISIINGTEHKQEEVFEIRRIRVTEEWSIETFDTIITANTTN